MNKRLHSSKAMALFLALSSAVIIAGIILYALLGFNVSATEYRTVDVTYDAVVTIANKEEALQEICEKTFSSEGIGYSDKKISTGIDVNYLTETGETLLTYTFSESVGENTLKTVVSLIESSIRSDASFTNADVSVEFHAAKGEAFYTAIWRGAIAVCVGVALALVYIGFRFGWDSALAGLVAAVHDAFLTLSLFAITRIPVYAYAPLLFAAVAALLSVLFWILQSAKMRENFKETAYATLSAADAVEESAKTSYKTVLAFLVPLAAALVVFGAIATAGVRLFMLPALIPLAVSAYSSLLLAPAVYAPIKGKFDRMRTKHKRYNGKKKAVSAEE